ncbi:MAG TPA: heme biosynthesis HemY N-terminal domain-containing protein [Hyphomicrobiaceae bacterium]|nr:heme biosynthesis HemY N-terminal domain-containing protein [Hyphomicrobiaceae bacterium]
MVRLIAFLLVVAALASGLSWLADRPGSLVINWQGYELETSVFRAIVLLALLIGLSILLWSLLRSLWHGPATLGAFLNRRRQARGLEALSTGLIALGAGDRALALRSAVQAKRALPNEPLTHLLRAQAAKLGGDRATARRIFEAMLGAPHTELVGLRGLYLEAIKENEREAARQFAARAVARNPKLSWPIEALFDLQCKEGDWAGALETLTLARRHQHIDRATAQRRRAVLLTARAQAAEDSDPLRAMQLALEAHNLAPDLVPAAAIAGRLLAARGHTARAAKVLERTWKRSPHPELAIAYAHARVGDSPRDRLERVRHLADLNPQATESAIALATAAIDARDWALARKALAPLIDGKLTARVCVLMARLEGEELGDTGRVREWLARAVTAPRDPAWTADGVVSDRWAPVSPVTGALDAFQWRVPVEALEQDSAARLARKLDEIVKLGTGSRIRAPLQAASPPPEPEPKRAQAVAVEEAPSATAAPGGPAAPSDAEPKRPPAAVPLPAVPTTDAPLERVAEAPTDPAAGAASKRRPKMIRRPAEPKIFVAPRPPDDPGLDPGDPVTDPASSYRGPIKDPA